MLLHSPARRQAWWQLRSWGEGIAGILASWSIAATTHAHRETFEDFHHSQPTGRGVWEEGVGSTSRYTYVLAADRKRANRRTKAKHRTDPGRRPRHPNHTARPTFCDHGPDRSRAWTSADARKQGSLICNNSDTTPAAASPNSWSGSSPRPTPRSSPPAAPPSRPRPAGPSAPVGRTVGPARHPRQLPARQIFSRDIF